MNNKTDKVTINQDYYFSYRLRTSEQTIDLFGEDYLQDYGLDVPSELVEEYRAIMVQYEALQDKLRELYKQRW